MEPLTPSDRCRSSRDPSRLRQPHRGGLTLGLTLGLPLGLTRGLTRGLSRPAYVVLSSDPAAARFLAHSSGRHPRDAGYSQADVAPIVERILGRTICPPGRL